MLLSLILAQSLLDPDILSNPAVTRPWRSNLAYFEAFPASGAGTTTACACTQPSVVGTGLTSPASITTTRTNAQGGYCTNSDYSLTLCPSNTARVMTGGGSTYLPLGILTEFIAGQNDALQVRDASNAAFVKTNMTCVKTATGADGVANAASTCTSTAINGTVAQTVVVVGQRALSWYVKRRTGTSTISVAPDGATFTDITARLSTTVYKRLVPAETLGCMYGGCIVVRGLQANFAANPVFTLKFAASGDALDLDFIQVEGGYETTSPIASAAVAGTRGAETNRATVPATQIKSLSSWSVVSSHATGGAYDIQAGAFAVVNTNELGINQGVSYGPLLGSPTCFWWTGGVFQEATGPLTLPTMGPLAQSCTNTGTTVTTNVAGLTSSAAATSAAASGVTTLSFGSRAGGTGANITSRYCADTGATRCATAAVVTPSPVAWVGDSITAGSVSAPIMPPSELTQLLGRPVWNHGVPGDAATACGTRYTSNIAGKGYATLVYACGTNDLVGGLTGAQIFALSQATLDAALASGLRVIAATILPFKKNATWTAPIQVKLEAYNTALAAWCVANPTAVCVDSYAAMGGGTGGVCVGADPACLLNAYDSGDGRHPNGVGAAYLASLVYTANP